MFIIGEVNNKQIAQLFSNYLSSLNMSNQLRLKPDYETQEIWQVLIADEKDLVQARTEWQMFAENPSHPRYRQAAWDVGEVQNASSSTTDWFGPLRTVLRSPDHVTHSLLALATAVFLLHKLSGGYTSSWLMFSLQPYQTPQIVAGELWRLVTPVLVHFSLMHLVFNMLWLWQFGTRLERRLGHWPLITLVVVTGMISNISQYYAQHAYFGGLSGVNYGLLGYLWIRGRLELGWREPLIDQIFVFLVIFLLLGYFGVLDVIFGPMANMAHLSGLIAGLVLGAVHSLMKGRS